MIGAADDQQVRVTGDRVLGDHALAGLHVALHESRTWDPVAGFELRLETVGAGLDVEGDDLVGVDERQRELRVRLVGPHPVRKAARGERGAAAVLAHPLDGELAEPPGERGVLAAADPEHEAVRVGLGQVLDEELNPALDLGGGVDLGDTPRAWMISACISRMQEG